jgi:hypothetical protein
MAPQVAPAQPVPETLQFTAVFVVPVTVAVNCCLLPVSKLGAKGETETAIGSTTVTVAKADLLASACEVAVTLTVAGVGTEPGAVYKPAALMVPHPAPLQPDRLQVTAVFVVPVTVALNCCLAPVTTFGAVGEIETATGGNTVTVTEADTSGFACEVAVTETVGGAGTEPGAVYSPAVVMLPHVAPLQPAPEILQVTAVFAVPVTVAVNCCWLPTTSFAIVGEIETAIPVATVTVAVADLLVSACEVAFTLTVDGFGTEVGAV